MDKEDWLKAAQVYATLAISASSFMNGGSTASDASTYRMLSLRCLNNAKIENGREVKDDDKT